MPCDASPEYSPYEQIAVNPLTEVFDQFAIELGLTEQQKEQIVPILKDEIKRLETLKKDTSLSGLKKAYKEMRAKYTVFGPFYDGLTHLFVTPEDLLPVIALALLAGLRGPHFGRAVLFALPVAWLIGSAGGLWLGPHIALPVPETIITIALGALLAADRPLSLAFVASLAILLGLLHGILSGFELPKAPPSGQLIAAGVAVALFIAVSLLAGQAASVRLPWMRVAVRVAGSWIAAIGLLMLGWSMRVPA